MINPEKVRLQLQELLPDIKDSKRESLDNMDFESACAFKRIERGIVDVLNICEDEWIRMEQRRLAHPLRPRVE